MIETLERTAEGRVLPGIAAAALAVGLAGCSGDSPATPSGVTSAVTVTTPTATKSPRPPGEVSGVNTAKALVKSCTPTSTGTRIVLSVTNITKQRRTYVVAVGVMAAGKQVGGVPLVTSSIAPGASTAVTGDVRGAVKGKVTCKVTNINSMV